MLASSFRPTSHAVEMDPPPADPQPQPDDPSPFPPENVNFSGEGKGFDEFLASDPANWNLSGGQSTRVDQAAGAVTPSQPQAKSINSFLAKIRKQMLDPLRASKAAQAADLSRSERPGEQAAEPSEPAVQSSTGTSERDEREAAAKLQGSAAYSLESAAAPLTEASKEPSPGRMRSRSPVPGPGVVLKVEGYRFSAVFPSGTSEPGVASDDHRSSRAKHVSPEKLPRGSGSSTVPPEARDLRARALAVLQRHAPSSSSGAEAEAEAGQPREPAVREPAVKEPAVEEPAVEEPAVKEPGVQEEDKVEAVTEPPQTQSSPSLQSPTGWERLSPPGREGGREAWQQGNGSAKEGGPPVNLSGGFRFSSFFNSGLVEVPGSGGDPVEVPGRGEGPVEMPDSGDTIRPTPAMPAICPNPAEQRTSTNPSEQREKDFRDRLRQRLNLPNRAVTGSKDSQQQQGEGSSVAQERSSGTNGTVGAEPTNSESGTSSLQHPNNAMMRRHESFNFSIQSTGTGGTAGTGGTGGTSSVHTSFDFGWNNQGGAVGAPPSSPVWVHAGSRELQGAWEPQLQDQQQGGGSSGGWEVQEGCSDPGGNPPEQTPGWSMPGGTMPGQAPGCSMPGGTMPGQTSGWSMPGGNLPGQAPSPQSPAGGRGLLVCPPLRGGTAPGLGSRPSAFQPLTPSISSSEGQMVLAAPAHQYHAGYHQPQHQMQHQYQHQQQQAGHEQQFQPGYQQPGPAQQQQHAHQHPYGTQYGAQYGGAQHPFPHEPLEAPVQNHFQYQQHAHQGQQQQGQQQQQQPIVRVVSPGPGAASGAAGAAGSCSPKALGPRPSFLEERLKQLTDLHARGAAAAAAACPVAPEGDGTAPLSPTPSSTTYTQHNAAVTPSPSNSTPFKAGSLSPSSSAEHNGGCTADTPQGCRGGTPPSPTWGGGTPYASPLRLPLAAQNPAMRATSAVSSSPGQPGDAAQGGGGGAGQQLIGRKRGWAAKCAKDPLKYFDDQFCKGCKRLRRTSPEIRGMLLELSQRAKQQRSQAGGFGGNSSSSLEQLLPGRCSCGTASARKEAGTASVVLMQLVRLEVGPYDPKSDGMSWRKYGDKSGHAPKDKAGGVEGLQGAAAVANLAHGRLYYKCTKCSKPSADPQAEEGGPRRAAKKMVQPVHSVPGLFLLRYEGAHSHAVPSQPGQPPLDEASPVLALGEASPVLAAHQHCVSRHSEGVLWELDLSTEQGAECALTVDEIERGFMDQAATVPGLPGEEVLVYVRAALQGVPSLRKHILARHAEHAE